MLLCIDIGNTNITIGVYKKKLEGVWRICSDTKKTPDEYNLLLNNLIKQRIKNLALASVVPQLTNIFVDVSKKNNWNLFIITEKSKMKIKNAYKNPSEVGIDRLINAEFAYKKFGCECIIVDFGTAVTIDCVNRIGEYIGGLIFPGPAVSSEILSQKTAKLPKIGLKEKVNIIGKTTEESIQSGLLWGYVNMVSGGIEKIKKEIEDWNGKTILTGGLCRFYSRFIDFDLVDDNLTLKGIESIYRENLR